MEHQELAEFYELICNQPPGSFRCLYEGVPIFEVDELEPENNGTPEQLNG